jgi:hypothetical protein
MTVIISFYDYTGEMVKPAAKAGATCFCYDIQHEYWQKEHPNATTHYPSGGSITYLRADLHNPEVIMFEIPAEHKRVDFVFGFPVCTDLAVSGAAHFAKKREANPEFQELAAGHAMMIAAFASMYDCPYMIENPVSVLSTLWRKPEYTFHPFEYGGYIPESEAKHPTWPEYIPDRDAYSKKTCLWTKDFKMPEKKPVPCDSFGSSKQHRKLGGKSAKTKNIRSATPRGFANAVLQSNFPWLTIGVK